MLKNNGKIVKLHSKKFQQFKNIEYNNEQTFSFLGLFFEKKKMTKVRSQYLNEKLILVF